MNAKFATFVESLEPAFQRLIQMTPVCAERLPQSMPKQGIYLFSEGAKHLYAGRSDNIRERIGRHFRATSKQYQANFAFRMARQQTGHTEAAYTASGSRRQMVEDAVFGPAFVTCKARIRSLDLRFVEERGATRQALLEIYAAKVLATPFNDFENS